MTGRAGPAVPATLGMQRVQPALSGEIETADLHRVLWHRRAWIAAATLVLVAAALLYCLLTPWLYTATAQILIDPRDKVVVTNDVNPTTMAPDGGVAQVESQVRVLESTSVLLRAIKALDLAQDPEFGPRQPGPLGRLLRWFDPGSAATDVATVDPATQQALINLRKRLIVKRADKVLVIDVEATATTPAKAARIANAITQAYLDDQAAARADTAIAASDALSARLAEQQRKVKDAEDAVERYKADNGLVSVNGLLVSDQRLTDITNQLDLARTRAAETRARLDQIDAARGAGSNDATAEALGSTVMTQLRSREAALVEQEAQLNVQLGPRHPSVAALAAQRHDIERLIGMELARIARSARADDDRAQANVNALQVRLATLTGQSLTAKQASIRLRELERDLEASRTVYAQYLLRTQETREQASVDSSNARIITIALPPRDRSWPLIGYLVLGALGAGLGLGAAGAFAAAYVAPVILSPGQLRDVLDLPVAVVKIAPRLAVVGTADSEAATEPKSGGLVVARGARGTAARAAMNDQAALDFVLRRVVEATPVGRGANRIFSVVFTCSRGQEERSAEMARRLATAADALGERVLLVDAAAADDQTTIGLLDVLRGDVTLDAVVRHKPSSNVAVLTRGIQLPGLADLRLSRHADRLYAQAARNFDIMVVNGGVATDNIRLAALIQGADEILIVAERDRTSQRDVIAAADALFDLGCPASRAVLVELTRAA